MSFRHWSGHFNDSSRCSSGTYTVRVKTPTQKGCEVVINGFRVGFSNMNDVTKLDRNDGYSYELLRFTTK